MTTKAVHAAGLMCLTCAVAAGLAGGGAVASTGDDTCLGKTPTIVGTPGKDKIRLNRRIHRHAVVDLQGGRDRVYVSEPHIRICAGTGNDNIILLDNHGEDLAIDAGPGDDEVDNRMDFETEPSPGPIFADGGAGDDFIQTGDYRDKILGGSGDDLVGAADAEDKVFGGPGHDRLHGGPLSDRLFGGPGDDLLHDDPAPAPDYWTLGDHDLADGGNGLDECAAERERDCEGDIH